MKDLTFRQLQDYLLEHYQQSRTEGRSFYQASGGSRRSSRSFEWALWSKRGRPGFERGTSKKNWLISFTTPSQSQPSTILT